MTTFRPILFLGLLTCCIPALAQEPPARSAPPTQLQAHEATHAAQQARATRILAQYRGKVLCASTDAAGRRTTRVVSAAQARQLRCTSTTPLSGIQVSLEARTVRFPTSRLPFQQKPGGTLSCKDPDGDFEHCNDVCDSVPQTPESGSTGCSLGCLAAYIWDGIWCD